MKLRCVDIAIQTLKNVVIDYFDFLGHIYCKYSTEKFGKQSTL